MAKELPEHKDKLGQTIVVDDFVAFPVGNSLQVGKVTKINPKMIKVEKLPARQYGSEWNKYPSDIIKIDSSLTTLYLLTAKP